MAKKLAGSIFGKKKAAAVVDPNTAPQPIVTQLTDGITERRRKPYGQQQAATILSDRLGG